MKAHNYDAWCIREEIYIYADTHGTLTGCECVEPEHLAEFNEIMEANKRLFAVPTWLPIDDDDRPAFEPSESDLAEMSEFFASFRD